MSDQNLQSLLLGKISAYTEILVKDPNSTIFVSLAETYRKIGMFEDARQIIFKGLDLHPDFSPAHIVLARVLCQLDDLGGSVVAFKRALELDDESLAALVGFARVELLRGEVVAARDLLLNARRLSPADPIINKLLLSLPEVIETVEEKIDDISGTDVDSVADTGGLVSSTLADLYLAQGLTGKALDLYQQLSLQNPADLALRRRVKELEEQLSGEDYTASTAAVEANGQLNGQLLPPDEAAVESDDAFDEDPILDTFNLWLSRIKQRRGNV
ncbi:MAG: hypothetical protein U9R69_12060 [Thermodesulfobacteriota bacterium]|nr:hypothetical protein [Thermodesulfobacteriota bacterium]